MSGSFDSTLRIGDLETGESRILQGHTGTVHAVCVTADGRRAVSGSDDNTLRVWNLDTGQLVAAHASSAGAVLSVAERFPMVIAGTATRLDRLVLIFRGETLLSLVAPRIATSVRLWLAGSGVTGGRWDVVLTSLCRACGKRSPVPATILDTVGAIARNAGVGAHDSPFRVGAPARLPVEAWDDPHLLGECPSCRAPLRFNPFVVDNRERLPQARRRRWWPWRS